MEPGRTREFKLGNEAGKASSQALSWLVAEQLGSVHYRQRLHLDFQMTLLLRLSVEVGRSGLSDREVLAKYEALRKVI